ncbi:8-oxoguanine glycosylase ogg1 [Metarhizium rileyi]|uniref:DNA-(apurinic or apyrimidinic site) lyase n=1 Tax=Metarhizium rileyi (strain RCEF 4871) TaxID=1649241 RepID=A0A5C6GLJ2_METRR|nr:8-oxoguanine glycosylase ogg1 [Metarhizium rileyi]
MIDELKDDDTEELLRRYFSLNLDLGALYDQWSKSDPNFQKKAPEFKGAQKLCIHYGSLIGYIDGEPMHDFPTPDSLTGQDIESRLRALGFGYRARYIADTARVVALQKPISWLESLRNPRHLGPKLSSSADGSSSTYKEAHEALLSLTGVGPKVADCVCLMGLGWGESVPVDTHVWQIAQRDYKFGKSKTKTFNKAMYDAVGDHFRGIWGEYAGWAHSVLFTADLREFSDRKMKTQVVGVVEPVQVKLEPKEEGFVPKRPKKRRSDVEAKEDTKTVMEDAADSKKIETSLSRKRRKTRSTP